MPYCSLCVVRVQGVGTGLSRSQRGPLAECVCFEQNQKRARKRRCWNVVLGGVRNAAEFSLYFRQKKGLSDRRMEFNGQIRSEWTNVAHLKKRFEAPYEAARATRPPNTPNPTKNRPQDTHNTLTEQENSARASSADQLSIRWAIRPKRQNRRLRTLRSPNSRPERAPARAWCGRRRACRPGRWGRS